MTYEEKRELCARPVTLDGERATISGARLIFAIVASLETAKRAEWSWETVKRIVETKDGKFTL